MELIIRRLIQRPIQHLIQRRKRLHYIWFAMLVLLTGNIVCLTCAYAQGESLFGTIQSVGARESYGINDLTILKNQTSAAGNYPYATRHHRRDEGTAIGGSFIDTTSDTSESSSAKIPHSIAPVVHDITSPPDASQSIYGRAEKTPALYGSLNKQSFDIDSERALQKSPRSPALTTSPEPSWAATESALIKKPAAVGEPLEHLNLHKAGGSTSFPY